jgi:secreted trypsin-like serine protease
MRIVLGIACTLVALAAPGSASAVIGGKTVQSGAYPYVVAVGDAQGPECGGTLIAASVVLTAAHCVAGRQASSVRVLLGSHALPASFAVAEASGRATRVTAVYVHPKFTPEGLHYDAALLLLAHPAAGLRAIAMSAASPAAGTRVSAAGWGMTKEHGATSPGHLRSVSVAVGTARSCGGGATPGRYFAPSMLCAGSPGRDTCSGDSGGPLVATLHGRLELVGITSFGIGCAEPRHPGMYTRVSSIRAWALEQVARSTAASVRLAELTATAARAAVPVA